MNAGRKLGANRALKPQQVWSIRFWLDHHHRMHERALSDLVIDSKLRGCVVVKIKIGDVVSGGHARSDGSLFLLLPHAFRFQFLACDHDGFASFHALQAPGCVKIGQFGVVPFHA